VAVTIKAIIQMVVGPIMTGVAMTITTGAVAINTAGGMIAMTIIVMGAATTDAAMIIMEGMSKGPLRNMATARTAQSQYHRQSTNRIEVKAAMVGVAVEMETGPEVGVGRGEVVATPLRYHHLSLQHLNNRHPRRNRFNKRNKNANLPRNAGQDAQKHATRVATGRKTNLLRFRS
jgi:hypothetical protein